MLLMFSFSYLMQFDGQLLEDIRPLREYVIAFYAGIIPRLVCYFQKQSK